MRVLLACEESQAVTREFRALGHEAYSCDILPTSGDNPEWHIQDDVLAHLTDDWDMIIGFPPCTYMTNGGAVRMYPKSGQIVPNRFEKAMEAKAFFMAIYNAPVQYVAVENADVANMSFLMNPIVKGELMQSATDAGSGMFVMDNANTVLGYNVAVSTLVPTNIASTKTAVIFGNWADLVIANFGTGVDLVVDPYTAAGTGQVVVTINSYWDVKLKQPKSFAFGNDITWSALS